MPMLSHVRALAEEIGPRGTGTPGEAAAADYVAERISALGLPVEWQTFRAVVSQNAFPMGINLVALLAVVLYPLGGPLTRWVARRAGADRGPPVVADHPHFR